jgi:putative ABC transport system permease protein
LALKEIKRAKLRFGLLAGAVALLIFLILFQQALLGGLINQFIGALKNQSGDVVVYNEQARRNLEGSIILPDQQASVEQAAQGFQVDPLGEGTFTVEASGDEVDAVLFGYSLGGAGEPTTLIEGRLPEGPGEAVASENNRDEGFDIGDTVRVLPDVELQVVGLADTINYSVTPTMFVDITTYREATLAANPDARSVPPTALVIDTANEAEAAQLVDTINANADGVEALTRQEAVDSSPGVSSVRTSFAVILGLFYVVVPLVTGLFFLIVTFQKASALTLLRAIGAPNRALVKPLLIQIVLVVLAGAVLATALFAGAAQGGGDLGLAVEPRPIVITVAVILALALLAGMVAIRRVTRIDPIDATTGAGVRV